MIVWAWIFAILETITLPITGYCLLFSRQRRILGWSALILNLLCFAYWTTYLVLYYI